MLFAVTHAAPVEPQDLQRLARSACPVEVHYSETGSLNGHAAEAIYALDPDPASSPSKQEMHR